MELMKSFPSVGLNSYDALAGEISRRIFTRLGFNLTKTVQVFFGGFYASLDNNKNINGPLIENKSNKGFALGFLWNFYRSDKLVNIYNIK